MLTRTRSVLGAISMTAFIVSRARSLPDGGLSNDCGGATSDLSGDAQTDISGHRQGPCCGHESKDSVTASHGDQVAELAVGVARPPGVCDGELDGIFVGTVLHNIGKIAMPTEILMRTHPLTKEKSALIRRHPLDGAEIIWSMQFP